jgi:hypothetical protein
MLRAPSEICLSNLNVHFVDFSMTQENKKTGKILSMTVEIFILFISLGGRGGDFGEVFQQAMSEYSVVS